MDEEEIEQTCREVKCPICHMRVGFACCYGRLNYGPHSHTARYLLAQEQGRLLPRLEIPLGRPSQSPR